MEFTDAKNMKIPRFKNFRDELKANLVAFEKRKDWADLTKAIANLQKTMMKYKDVGVMPEKLLLSKRLGQTLNISLPSGVHKKTLELYKTVFQIVGSKLEEDLPVYAPGLFKVFPDASMDIKPLVYEIYKEHFLPLSSRSLRPCLGGLLSSILPVLEEENSELYPDVLSLLQAIQTKFCDDGMQGSFMLHLWETLKYNEPSRLACLNYLLTILPRTTKKRSEPVLTEELLGGAPEVAVSAMVAVLGSNKEMVLRTGLDLLSNSMMLHVQDQFTEAQKTKLIECALVLMGREELPLTRRISKWFSGDDKPCPEYFTKNSADRVSKAYSRLIAGVGDSPQAAHLVIKLSELLNPEAQEAAMPQYCKFLLSGVCKPSDALRPLRAHLLLDFIAQSFENPNASPETLKTIVDVATVMSGYIEVRQKNHERLVKVVRSALDFTKRTVLSPCSDSEEAYDQLIAMQHAIKTVTLMTKAYTDVLCSPLSVFEDLFKSYLDLACLTIDALQQHNEEERITEKKMYKGVSSSSEVNVLTIVVLGYIKEGLSVVKDRKEQQEQRQQQQEDQREPEWLTKMLVLYKHADCKMGLECSEILVDVLCCEKLPSSAAYEEELIRYLWICLSEQDECLYAKCEQLLKICNNGKRWQTIFDQISVADMRNGSSLTEQGFSRFLNMWHALEDLGAHDPGLLREPLKQALETLQSGNPTERNKGVSFLQHASGSIGRIFDPYLSMLFNSQAVAADPKFLEYVLTILQTVIDRCPQAFITHIIDTDVSESISKSYEEYSNSTSPPGTYLDVLAGICVYLVSTSMSSHDVDLSVRSGTLLLSLIQRASNSPRNAKCVKVCTSYFETCVRSLSASLLPEPVPVLSLLLVDCIYGLARYMQLKADFSDLFDLEDGSSKSFNGWMLPNTSVLSSSNGGNRTPYQMLVSLLIDGVTYAAKDEKAGIFNLKQWCTVYKNFLPLFGDIVQGLAEASHSHFTQLLNNCLTKDATPHQIQVMEEILNLISTLGTWLLSIQPKKDAIKSENQSASNLITNFTTLFKDTGANGSVSGELFEDASPSEIAMKHFCQGFDSYLKVIHGLECVIQDEEKPFAILRQKSLRVAMSKVLTSMFKANPWHFFNGVMFLWASHIMQNNWRPIIEAEADVHYVDLLLLVQPLGVRELTAGIIEVTNDLSNKVRNSIKRSRDQVFGNYELFGADLLTQYITYAPIDAIGRLVKVMPSLLSWIKDMTSANAGASHAFSHSTFLRLLCSIVTKFTEVINTQGNQWSSVCRSYLQDKKSFKEVYDTFAKLLEAVPRLMAANEPSPQSSVDIISAAMDLITADLKLIKKTSFLGTSERMCGLVVGITQQHFSTLFKMGEDNPDRATPLRRMHIKRIHSALAFLTEAVRTFTPVGMRPLRPIVLDHISDTLFFRVDQLTLSLWRTLFSLLVGGSDAAVKEMIENTLAKIQLPTGMGSVFSSAEKEAQNRAKGLRRLAFLLTSSGTHLSNAHLLATILEKLIESMKNYSEWPFVSRQILICFRAILCQTDAHSLAPFWPLIVTELVSVLSNPKAEKTLVIEALKVIDTARVVLPSDFHTYRWIFIDSEGGSHPTDGCYTPLVEVLSRLPQAHEGVGDDASENPEAAVERVLNVIAGVRVDGDVKASVPLLTIPERLYEDVLGGSVCIEEIGRALQVVATKPCEGTYIKGVSSQPGKPDTSYILRAMEVDLAELHLASPGTFFRNLAALMTVSAATITRSDSLTHQPFRYNSPSFAGRASVSGFASGKASRTPPPQVQSPTSDV
eukprot:TRINITY_DN8304_c0_g1_i1.p1 TRINITY_DN8304_c0_g1~~TRINITY_DN8304_c0_g1_i1.p1  ORF type:complete len:1778 (+),score=281.84 TRINITY_DN8304_c0_g1_i1:55-5388(+)